MFASVGRLFLSFSFFVVLLQGMGCAAGADTQAECKTGARRCGDVGVVELCVAAHWQAEQDCEAGDACFRGECKPIACVDACAGAECGDDSCGGVCGECGEEGVCVNKQCVNTVQTCGDGRCDASIGESCTSCAQDCACGDEEVCRQGACEQPPASCGNTTCEGNEDCSICPADCGSCCGDGMCRAEQGENCATCLADCGCSATQACDAASRSCEEQCIPNCGGRSCGDDGCGGSCGGCLVDELCDSMGRCVAPGPSCGDTMCEGTEDCSTCPADCGACCGDGTCDANLGEYCGTCLADCGCAAGEICNTTSRMCEAICTPNCAANECGADGCGGTCGSCAGGDSCVGGQCMTMCTPSCAGRTCGGDGCGGSCGICASGAACNAAGQCAVGGTCAGCGATESCLDGICRAPVELCSMTAPNGVCASGFDCVAGSCNDAASGCSAQNTSGVCALGSVCRSGRCEAVDTVSLCNDDNACTADSFDYANNKCQHVATNGSCSDGNSCTSDRCMAGQCVAMAIAGCIEPPSIDPVTSPTNENSLTLSGTKPAGAAVIINGQPAVAESPETTWSVTVNLATGGNAFVVKSRDRSGTSGEVNVNVVYDITPPTIAATPAGGTFLNPVTMTVAGSEPARIYYSVGELPVDEFSPSFDSLRKFRVTTSGRYNFRARDRAGNWQEGSTSASFVISGADGQWKDSGVALLNAMSLFGATAHDDKIYIAGGTSGSAALAGFYSINIADGAVEALTSFTIPRTQNRLVFYGGQVYSVGGENDGTPLNHLQEISPGGSTWRSLAPMPTTRFGMEAIVVADDLFVLGGKTNGGRVLNSMEIYRFSSDTWRNDVVQMPRARYAFAAHHASGKIYVAGGENAAGVPVAEVDIYDIASDSWTTGASLPTPRSFASSGLNYNVGSINTSKTGMLIAGGRGIAGAASAVVEEYVVEDDRWVVRQPLANTRHSAGGVMVNVPDDFDLQARELWVLGGMKNGMLSADASRYRHNFDYISKAGEIPAGRFNHASEVLGGKLFVFGGRNFQEETAGYIYDLQTKRAVPMAELPSFQNRLASAKVDGEIYAIGGANNFGLSVAKMRQYDAVSDRWIEKSPLQSGRADAAVATLNGKIYVMGGDNNGALQSVEIYDPVADSWSAGPVLPTGLSGARAQSFQGAIILFGGRNNSNAENSNIYRLAGGTWTSLRSDMPAMDSFTYFRAGNRIVIIVRVGTVKALHVYDMSTNRLSVAGYHFSDSLRSFESASADGEVVYLVGGIADETMPPANKDILKINARSFDGVENENEVGIDLGAGAPPSPYGTPFDIVDNKTRSGTVTLPAVRNARTCWLELVASHTRPQEVTISLISPGPGGRTFSVHNRAPSFTTSHQFDVVEVTTGGVWTLSASDHAGGDEGRVSEWSLVCG